MLSKISAPPIGLMIENRDEKPSRKATSAVAKKLRQSAPTICSMPPPDCRTSARNLKEAQRVLQSPLTFWEAPCANLFASPASRGGRPVPGPDVTRAVEGAHRSLRPRLGYGAPALGGALMFSALYYAGRRRARARPISGFDRSIFPRRIVLPTRCRGDSRAPLWFRGRRASLAQLKLMRVNLGFMGDEPRRPEKRRAHDWALAHHPV